MRYSKILLLILLVLTIPHELIGKDDQKEELQKAIIRSKIYFDQGLFDKAFTDYDYIMETDSTLANTNLHIYFGLGYIYHNLKDDTSEALHYYGQYLKHGGFDVDKVTYNVYAVKKYKRTNDISFLIESLASDQMLIREGATKYLLENEDAAIDPLLRALYYSKDTTKYMIVYILGEIADPKTSDALNVVFENDPNPNIRNAANEALEKISKVTQIEPGQPETTVKEIKLATQKIVIIPTKLGDAKEFSYDDSFYRDHLQSLIRNIESKYNARFNNVSLEYSEKESFSPWGCLGCITIIGFCITPLYDLEVSFELQASAQYKERDISLSINNDSKKKVGFFQVIDINETDRRRIMCKETFSELIKKFEPELKKEVE